MNSEFDPHAYAMGRVRATTPEFVWSPDCDEAWVAALRARLSAAIGAVDDARCPLDARSGPVEQGDGYTIQQVDFVSRPGLRVFGYWLDPGTTGAAIICVPGHGVGVDALVGNAPEDYQNQFALQCVRQGYRVLAVEPCSFGHRRSAAETQKDSSCIRDAMAALMLGESLIGWRVRDAMVSVDYLLAQGVEKVGIMGISGGGLVALWTAALDPRIDASVVSGYFNTFADSTLSIDHCVDNFAPGISNIVEMPDLAALIAPKALFVESGDTDPIFPRAAFEHACGRAQEIYGNGPFGKHLFEGDHFFCGTEAFKFLAEHLTP